MHCGLLPLYVLSLSSLLNIEHIINLVSNKKIDISGSELFKGKHLRRLTALIVAIVCFVLMTIRLIFRIY